MKHSGTDEEKTSSGIIAFFDDQPEVTPSCLAGQELETDPSFSTARKEVNHWCR